MKPRRFTALFILFVAIFAFWWGISVLSQTKLQPQAQARPMTLTVFINNGTSTASSTPEQISISLLSSSTPTIEGITVNGAQASTTFTIQ